MDFERLALDEAGDAGFRLVQPPVVRHGERFIGKRLESLRWRRDGGEQRHPAR